MSILKVKNVSKIYTTRFGSTKVQALSNMNFTVEQGEYVAIMGESGSGKTTLLNILASLDRPTSGEVLLNGKNLTSIKEKEISAFRRDNLGFVFQEYNLLDTLTIGENIVLAMTLQNKSKKEIQKESEEMMRLLGIWEIRNQFPYQVSGGQKQRCACARALINHPKLLLADEPTGALDSKAAETLLETFQSLNASKRATIFMVTHDAFSASYCSRILFLKDGRIFHELIRGQKGRREFLNAILDVLSATGGVKDAR